MRRYFAVTLPFVVMLAFAGSASAQTTPTLAAGTPISTSYCEYSLRGGGTLAPDNDVKRRWDRIEALGVNIVSSGPVTWNRINDQYLRVLWQFYQQNGSVWKILMNCHRDNYSPTGTYRDDDNP